MVLSDSILQPTAAEHIGLVCLGFMEGSMQQGVSTDRQRSSAPPTLSPLITPPYTAISISTYFGAAFSDLDFFNRYLDALNSNQYLDALNYSDAKQ